MKSDPNKKREQRERLVRVLKRKLAKAEEMLLTNPHPTTAANYREVEARLRDVESKL